jgi:hypothetical protein
MTFQRITRRTKNAMKLNFPLIAQQLSDERRSNNRASSHGLVADVKTVRLLPHRRLRSVDYHTSIAVSGHAACSHPSATTFSPLVLLGFKNHFLVSAQFDASFKTVSDIQARCGLAQQLMRRRSPTSMGGNDAGCNDKKMLVRRLATLLRHSRVASRPYSLEHIIDLGVGAVCDGVPDAWEIAFCFRRMRSGFRA